MKKVSRSKFKLYLRHLTLYQISLKSFKSYYKNELKHKKDGKPDPRINLNSHIHETFCIVGNDFFTYKPNGKMHKFYKSLGLSIDEHACGIALYDLAYSSMNWVKNAKGLETYNFVRERILSDSETMYKYYVTTLLKVIKKLKKNANKYYKF